MKKLIIAALIGVASIANINWAHAQIRLSINIGSQPLWGPVGYDHVDYYYLPEIDAYYYVPTGQYIYLVNGAWVWRSYLPARYRNIDLYRTYKVVVNGDKPYLRHNDYRNKYRNYRTSYNKQVIIRDSKDRKYDVVRNRPNNRPTPSHPTRPGNGGPSRPERPGNGGKPERPGNGGPSRPERPGNGGKPERPGNGGPSRPERPGNGGKPERSGNGGKPERPGNDGKGRPENHGRH
ncbi:MAG: hypothetical protein P0Y49_05645 [Candidatus Pedobacter colombiensis]|uniref:DUF3300 domain-containing protein n=1 Tax=Candidatus Pedobacter colombiensis TaxID=3121371 RepID=A0AAJ5WBL9_9SPHI|nr:hypothetical protein [Pedobacter sp.]WEK20620.1 MAG: hypothetical protein P0Y49_05645 [Pedobacter sp.]